jgi:hypothetical protein
MSEKCLNFICVWRSKNKTCPIKEYNKCDYHDKAWLKQLAERYPKMLQEMPLLDLWDLCYFYEYGVIKDPPSMYCFFSHESDNPFVDIYEERRVKQAETMTKGDW